jgi:pantothenate synthetase
MHDGVADAEEVREAMQRNLGDLDIDCVSVADEQTLEELETIDRPAVILLASRIDSTRLIDNTIVVPKGVPVPVDLQSLLDN